MTLLGLSAVTPKKAGASEADLPADCTCNFCTRAIGATEPRWRCANTSCDDLHLCETCSVAPCPVCGASSPDLYCDLGSAFVLRTRVFRESFAPDSDAAKVVHPWVMVDRAFKVYAERPLLGEPRSDRLVRWWSYQHCGAAARAFARDLHQNCDPATAHPAVVICAANSAGWLIADWACAVAELPSITIDASDASARLLSTVCDAAALHGCTVAVMVVDAQRVDGWRKLLLSETAVAQAQITVFSTTDARSKLLGAGGGMAAVSGGFARDSIPAELQIDPARVEGLTPYPLSPVPYPLPLTTPTPTP